MSAAANALRQRSVGGRPSATGSPRQITSCPWCGSEIREQHLRVYEAPSDIGRCVTYCGDNLGRCDFSEAKAPKEGLPVMVVDEEIYRRPPALLIATVDKFAQMPWKGETQMLFAWKGPSLWSWTSAPPDCGSIEEQRMNELGELRPSQLIFTFGVGALVDLPNLSVIVLGLDDWDIRCCKEIEEDRLVAAVQKRLGAQMGRLYLPPIKQDSMDKDPAAPAVGVPVAPFPRWMRCPLCNTLATVESGVFKLIQDPYRPDRTQYVHQGCLKSVGSRAPSVLPVRFPPEEGFPGIRLVLLHSLAHALMRQIVLDCGYSAASIRERLYSRQPNEDGGPMAGILLYTAAADSEGTLGGLVELGEPLTLGRHLQQALESMRLCASDPLCADHRPDMLGRGIQGACCHACRFAPETSCERGNRYLDRSVLVNTFSARGTAFFD
ncbi:Zn-binding domain-containing protein [Thiocapsa sp.]|uniref:Zn-binding domain-containing protein n=1 Tax=Thiocapsa sp. TaxID=2024551 RepID=UPI002633DE6B|nr:Zn-binding domain-containing protein [Thiocapsa sp.]